MVMGTRNGSASNRRKVLYIEDDIGSQRLVRRVLENHDYEVLIAGEGLNGIDLARQASPHLILMDINLPGMNGREITTRLRALPNFNNTPIVALTANNSPGYRERALAAGCDGFLTKPIDISRFPRAVGDYLQGHREELEQKEKLEHLKLHAEHLVERLESKVQELEQANKRLRDLDRMKSSFIALVSHELRTPLTLLEGYSHLLDEQLGFGEEEDYPPGVFNLVQGLDVGVKRISQVINEIINVSRIASGKLDLSIGPVRVNDLVADVAALHREALAARNLTLARDDLAHLPLIEGDGRQLRTALSNVVENAIKYTPDGGKIMITARPVDSAVDVVVTDTGIGIPAEEQRRIFDQFYVLEAIEHHSTSKSAFGGGGLGLGLAVTKGIIEAHNGRIWVESQRSDDTQRPGSSFHLLLPRKQARMARAFEEE